MSEGVLSGGGFISAPQVYIDIFQSVIVKQITECLTTPQIHRRVMHSFAPVRFTTLLEFTQD